MGKGAKIALGCGIAAVLAVVAVVVVFLGGVFWVKGKAEKYVGNVAAKAEDIARYEKQANQNPFTPPADGAIQEAQLVKFLEVRKQIYTVYQQHKPEFDSLAGRSKDTKDLNFAETVEAGSLLARLAADVRLVQMKALAAVGMSETEYRFAQQAVYFSGWASEFQKESGKQPADMMAEGLKQTGTVATEAIAGAEKLRVPQANIDLFRKYEADIKQYAMTGLAVIGL